MLNMMCRFGGFLLLLIVGGVVAVTPPAEAQPESDSEKMRTRLDRQIGALIRSIGDIIWSDVRIYKLESDFKTRLVTSMQSEDEADLERLKQIGEIIAPDPIPSFDQTALSIAASPIVRSGQTFRTKLGERLMLDPEFEIEEDEANDAYNIAATIIQNRKGRPKNFYLVTSSDHTNPRLMALLGINLETGTPIITSFVKVGTQLYDYLSSNNTDSTMYEEMVAAVMENNTQLLSNQMFVLRDLANTPIGERTNTRATGIDANEHAWVVQSISVGRPIREEWSAADTTSDAGGMDDPWDLGLDGAWEQDETGVDIVKGAAVPGAIEHPNEIVVGTDVLAGYYVYGMTDRQVKETEWGVELLNNFDEINYPSIWGGRMTLNAILRNVKIGVVLPQPRFGGETIAESGLLDEPQKILGGYGIAFGGNFTAPMLHNSGLFNFHASYTFGESSTDAILPTLLDISPVGDTTKRSGGEVAYLIRYAFQGFYSFGFYADNNAKHLFRLKVGGAVYGVDTYERQQHIGPGESVDTVPALLKKIHGENQGGVAGKIEYMKGGTDIPYGAGFQYFDGSLQGNVWLQFVVSRVLDLKFEGKCFTSLFREPRRWEANSLVVPSIELKYHFGTP